MSTTTTAHWTATETRVVSPYLRHDEGLVDVALRIDPNDAFDGASKVWLERERTLQGLRPELRLEFDPLDIAEAVDVPTGDLTLHVSIRDRAVKRWSVVASWGLDETPTEYHLDLDARSWAIGRNLEIAVLVAPSQTLPSRLGRAYRPDQVVAVRSFSLVARKDGVRFNVSTVGSEWFTNNGLPKDAVWAIDWSSRDPSIEPIAALAVMVNEDHAERLQNAFGAQATSDALAMQLAIDVFVEAALVTLQSPAEFDPEPSTLMGAVASALGIETADQFDALRERVADDAGRIALTSYLRARAQARLGFAKSLKARNGRKR